MKKNLVSVSGKVYRASKEVAKILSPFLGLLGDKFDSAVLLAVAGRLYWFAGNKQGAEHHLSKAFLKSQSSFFIRRLYADIQKWQGRQWQQLDILEQGRDYFQGNVSYWLSLGEVQLEMNRLDDAQNSLQRVLSLRGNHARTWWLLGRVFAKTGDVVAYQHAYAQAVRFSWHPSVRRFGIGVWFESKGDWKQAVDAYREYSTARPFDANLHIRLARACENVLDWSEAASAYAKVLDIAPERVELSLAFAWVQARRGLWGDVSAICRRALQNQWYGYFVRKEIHHLLAISLSEVQQFDVAIVHFEKKFGGIEQCKKKLKPGRSGLGRAATKYAHRGMMVDYVSSAWNALEIEAWQQAAYNLEAAIERWPNHEPLLYIALGHSLARVGQQRRACEMFRRADLYRWPRSPAQKRYERMKALRQVIEYTEYTESVTVQPDIVLYESYAGVSIGCNPYAIYQAIVDDPEFAGWRHVWVLNDPKRIPESCLERKNVIFVSRDSQLYRRYLATAKWLINNSTFPPYFIRQQEQRYLNTWHGTPLKTLGKDIRGNFMEHKNTARNLLQATHVISPNKHTSRVLIERNDIAGLYQGKLAETGYPRNDLVLNASPAQKQVFRQRLGLQGGELKKPLVLYAPTWRGILGHPELDAGRLVADLEALKKLDCEIVFRGHYFSEKVLAESGLNVHVAPQSMDTSELLAITDVLITDYSSIFFDYLPAGRPILFYTYDLDQYSQVRGLYFEMQEMPGPSAHSIEALCSCLSQTLLQLSIGDWQPDARYRAAQQLFCAHEDGEATQRVKAFFFGDADASVVPTGGDGRQTLLFFAGPFTPNGITTAALNLINAFDETRYRIVMAIDPAAVASQPERLERLSRLPRHVQILGRVGRQVCSAQERHTIDRFHRYDVLGTLEWQTYENAFEREFQRMFGNWSPNWVINYDGYQRFWAGLFGCGPKASVGRIIYLHNDMYGEWKVRFPRLAGMFALYRYYDQSVSVAEAISQANCANLAESFSLEASRFTHVDNMPDFSGVQARALEPLEADLEEWLRDVPAGQVFVTIGRLSPEKNHLLLLEAFAMLRERFPEARLVILGDGALRPVLETRREELGLQTAVLMPGIRSNPFPLLYRADCFVLSSRHEGQPMVLLEAMALRKPIVATNISGVRELLSPGYGHLVEPEPEMLAEGMSAQANGVLRLKCMDVEVYRKHVLEQFESLLKAIPRIEEIKLSQKELV